MNSHIRVGAYVSAQTDVERFVKAHLNGQNNGYPAYDSFSVETRCGPLTDPDLLAPALLNSLQKPLRAYYSLQQIKPILNERLERLDEISAGETLMTASDKTLEAVAALYGVLDDHAVPQVKLVTLSKVLHRKRPHLIPITDSQIQACYRPLLGVKPHRTYKTFVLEWLAYAKDDLSTQVGAFEELAALAPAQPIGPLRALDIAGWGIGGGHIPSVTSIDSQTTTSINN